VGSWNSRSLWWVRGNVSSARRSDLIVKCEQRVHRRERDSEGKHGPWRAPIAATTALHGPDHVLVSPDGRQELAKSIEQAGAPIGRVGLDRRKGKQVMTDSIDVSPGVPQAVRYRIDAAERRWAALDQWESRLTDVRRQLEIPVAAWEEVRHLVGELLAGRLTEADALLGALERIDGPMTHHRRQIEEHYRTYPGRSGARPTASKGGVVA